MHHHPAAGLAVLGALALLGTSALPSVAFARTVAMPEKQPVVSFEVPDDWTVTPVGNGLELKAPDRTSVIETGIVKRGKDEIIAWQKSATQRMKAFGVSFDAKASASRAGGKAGPTGTGHFLDPKTSRPGPSAGELPNWSMAPPLPSPDAPPAGTEAAAPGRADDKPSAASDAKPAEAKDAGAKPDQAESAETKPVENKSAEAKPVEAKPVEAKPVEAKAVVTEAGEAKRAAAKATATGGRPQFRSVVLYGAVLDGKSVDVQFFDFSAGGGSAFVMQQESRPTDGRAAAIVKSLRFLR